MQQGLYEVEYSAAGAVGRSVMCVHAGQMLGGNSGFAHIGTYVTRDGETSAEMRPGVTTTIRITAHSLARMSARSASGAG